MRFQIKHIAFQLTGIVCLLLQCTLLCQSQTPVVTIMDKKSKKLTFEPSIQEIEEAPVFIDLKKAKQHPKKVYKLDLTGQGYTSFPVEILLLTELRYLQLDKNPIGKIPSEIQNLKNLILISAEKTELTTFPTALLELEALELIDLSHNKLIKLPNQRWSQLVALQKLSLNGNLIDSIPASLCELKKLEALHIEDNRLTSIPKEISNLKNLFFLSLKNNHLSQLPTNLYHLENLETLDLSHNSITQISAEIGNLGFLSYLNISSNQIAVIPDEFYFLPYLEKLFIDRNKLTSLKKHVAEWQNLKVLDIGFNPITFLPKELGYLDKMEVLFIDSIATTAFPQALYDVGRNGVQIESDYVIQVEKSQKLFHKAQSYVLKGQDSLALLAYTEVINSDTNHLVALSEMGLIKMKQGLHEEAHSYFSKALTKRSVYADIKILRTRYEECLKLMNYEVKKIPAKAAPVLGNQLK